MDFTETDNHYLLSPSSSDTHITARKGIEYAAPDLTSYFQPFSYQGAAEGNGPERGRFSYASPTVLSRSGELSGKTFLKNT